MHALLVDLRRCPSANALFARHFDRRDALADLILLASLIPPTSPGTTWQEHAEVLLPIREAAFWARWRELVGNA